MLFGVSISIKLLLPRDKKKKQQLFLGGIILMRFKHLPKDFKNSGPLKYDKCLLKYFLNVHLFKIFNLI